MNISIVGMGYVGLVDAVCLASFNNYVICVDINSKKINQINNGISPIVEDGVQELLLEAKEKNLIEATSDYDYAINNSNITFISVDTPYKENVGLDMEHVFNVVKELANALKNKNTFHTIVLRSTIMPKVTDEVIDIVQDISNKKVDEEFGVVINPELLREGNAIKDYFNPPYILFGSKSQKSLDTMHKLYKDINAEVIECDVNIVEIIKLVNNTYHALKVTFANEIGNICKSLDIDSNRLMDIFCKDTILNISPYYFKPGNAYGGSCLTKDLNALCKIANIKNIDVPVIESINKSNDIQKKNALDIILRKNRKNIGILGLSFKAGTDDLRFSPTLELVKELIDRKLKVRIYDKNVLSSIKTNDRNRKELNELVSNINEDLDYICENSDVIVIANKSKEYENIPNKYPHKYLIDLVRQYDSLDYDGIYEGISWKIRNI